MSAIERVRGVRSSQKRHRDRHLAFDPSIGGQRTKNGMKNRILSVCNQRYRQQYFFWGSLGREFGLGLRIILTI
jgi:hypothetical protein